MSDEYHKINSIQKRYTEGPNKGKFTGEWVDPLYEYLQYNEWTCREKVDGTNIRIDLAYMLDNWYVGINGRTNNAQIPTPLLACLEELFPLEKLLTVFNDPSKRYTLYGEGFGAGIQKGGNYGPIDFILFDVKIGDYWLSEEDITGIAESLDIKRVPIHTDISTLWGAIQLISHHKVKSQLKNGEPEGLVCVPKVPLFNKHGERVIVKVKGIDYPIEGVK